MKQFLKTALVAAALLAPLGAQATSFDFAALANSGEYGIQPLVVSSGGITATINGYSSSDSTAFAYLDAGTGGLGVCKNLTSTNQCNPGNDDNVTSGEWLTFMFNQDVTIENLFFNNNHDGYFSASNNQVLINGSAVTVNATDGFGGPLNLAMGDLLTVGYADGYNSASTFYVQKMEVSSVPEPATLGLMGLGLLGLGLRSRRKA